jgi:hypothetical protein
MLCKIKTVFLLLFIVQVSLNVCSGQQKFTLEARWPLSNTNDPKEANWKLKAGSKTTFKCTSSQKFQLVKILVSYFHK